MSIHRDEDQIDGDQLPVEDTLDDRGLVDNLDEGISPPERPRGVTAKSVTPRGELEGETIDERVRQEEPDPVASIVHDADPADPDDLLLTPPEEDTLDDGQVGSDRSGRLMQNADDPDGVGTDEGIAGGAASAEEAAIHEISS